MSFLDEADVSDSNNENVPAEKIKTDMEIEAEYRHILYGGKKRKAPKIGIGKKRRKASTYNFPGQKTKKSSKPRTVQPDKQSTMEKNPILGKLVVKINTSNINREQEHLRLKTVSQSDTSNGTFCKVKQNYNENKNSSPQKNAKAKNLPLQAIEEKNNQEVKLKVKAKQMPLKEKDRKPCAKTEPVESLALTTQSWKGKMPNKKAYERSKMQQKLKKSLTSSKIEDVTGRYSQEEELVTCGICELLDPPADPNNPLSIEETTEWVGCDCYRWFHKCCTKLTKITEKFSCKSVKMKCSDSIPIPKKPVVQIAILRFFRDRDVTFIDDHW